ncbi:MAG: hypothetical protein ACRC68_17435 [Clostridium sp.]
MACRREWSYGEGKKKLTFICTNYPDTEEEKKKFSEIYTHSMIMGLEKQFGENWGTQAMNKVKELELKKGVE